MWGIRQQQRPSEGPGRFIPTHVGNTAGLNDIQISEPVHPHACGEYSISLKRAM